MNNIIITKQDLKALIKGQIITKNNVNIALEKPEIKTMLKVIEDEVFGYFMNENITKKHDKKC